MKKGIIGLTIGLFIGLSLSYAGPVYSAVKQYILTEFTKPVLVNGVEYADKEPILNYNGRTYIPLSKIGDLLGVEYQYNSKLNRVEIGSISGGLPEGGTLKPDSDTVQTDDDLQEQIKDQGDEALKNALMDEMDRAMITEKWISRSELDRKAGIYTGVGDAHININHTVLLSHDSELGHTKRLFEFTLPEGYMKSKDYDPTVVNGLTIKRENKVDYYLVDDLYKSEILPKDFNQKVKDNYMKLLEEGLKEGSGV